MIIRRLILKRAVAASLCVFGPNALPLFSYFALSSAAMTTTSSRVIDSHLHVWANEKEASSGGGFPYAQGQEPPESLQNRASTAELLREMDSNGVDGALIVQPINYKFDHSYVTKAIKDHPDRFKGMLLHDPSLSPKEAVGCLEDLSSKGFVGVRFNPYLWPKLDTKEGDELPRWTPMSIAGGSGLAVYKRCAELRMPVGIMCFQGLQLHYDDILELIRSSPETMVVLDHFGFTSFTPEGNNSFQKLLELEQYKNVFVKISAVFRLKDESPDYDRVKNERVLPLITTFGSSRLMFGSDFPFVLQQPQSYGGMVKLVSSWITDDKDRSAIMGGTAEETFGVWKTTEVTSRKQF